MDLLTFLTPVLIVVVRALRAIPALKSRTWLLPFVAAGSGVALAVLVSKGDYSTTIVQGLMAGFAASGLYDAGKGTKERLTKQTEETGS